MITSFVECWLWSNYFYLVHLDKNRLVLARYIADFPTPSSSFTVEVTTIFILIMNA